MGQVNEIQRTALTRYYLNVNVTTCVHRRGFMFVTRIPTMLPDWQRRMALIHGDALKA